MTEGPPDNESVEPDDEKDITDPPADEVWNLDDLLDDRELIEFSDSSGWGRVYESVVDETPEEVDPSLEEQHGRIDVQDHANTTKLRIVLGVVAIGLMAAQLVVADVAFFIYGFYNDWNVPSAVMNGWLASVVIQVIGVVLVVAKSLFPSAPTDTGAS